MFKVRSQVQCHWKVDVSFALLHCVQGGLSHGQLQWMCAFHPSRNFPTLHVSSFLVSNLWVFHTDTHIAGNFRRLKCAVAVYS